MKKKRFFCILLSVLLLCSLFSSCEKSYEHESKSLSTASSGKGSLRVLLDVMYGGGTDLVSMKKSFQNYQGGKSLEEVLEETCGMGSVSLEMLPELGEERETALSSLRTEVMAGNGPDVFICPTHNDLQLFSYPQQAMEHELFLALDEYLPNAQFAEWEKMPPVLAEAGKYEGSQYLVPLTFIIPVEYFRESEVQHELSETMTWEDMVQGDISLKTAAANPYRQAARSDAYQASAAMMPWVENNKLSFTEEELLDYIIKKEELCRKLENDPSVPDHDSDMLRMKFSVKDLDESLQDCSSFMMIPTYSRKGGYGAIVSSFAAVSAYTEWPEEAFSVVDYFLSKEFISSEFYEYLASGSGIPAIPARQGENYSDLREHVTFAEFNTPIASIVSDLFADVRSKTTGIENPERYNRIRRIEEVRNIEGKTTEELVHEAYRKMEKMLAES